MNTSGQSFIVQGPHGEQFTINVNGQTEWDGSASLSTLNTSSIVQVSGQLDPADQTLDADEVAVAFRQGLLRKPARSPTSRRPPAPPRASTSMCADCCPQPPAFNSARLRKSICTGSENYSIYWMHNPFTQFLFNSSGLVAGQSVAVGGPASGAANANAVTVNRVALRNWGFNGTIVKGSQSTANGSFQMQINGFAGVLVPETVTVYLGATATSATAWAHSPILPDGANIRVVGLLLKNPTNGPSWCCWPVTLTASTSPTLPPSLTNRSNS